VSILFIKLLQLFLDTGEAVVYPSSCSSSLVKGDSYSPGRKVLQLHTPEPNIDTFGYKEGKLIFLYYGIGYIYLCISVVWSL
jgi:hypothetical protein